MFVRVPLTRSRASVLALLGVVAVVVVLIATAIGLQPPPARPASAVPPGTPVLVSVAHPGSAIVALGYPTSLTVRALGSEPIAGIELWLGPRLLVSAANAGGGPAQVARFSWTPATPGAVVLVARATDAKGREAQSAALRLTVDPTPARYRPVRPVTLAAGETGAAAATRSGGSVAELPRWNPGLDVDAPQEAGTVVYVPLPVTEVPRPDPGTEIEALTGAGYFHDRVAGPGSITLASWTGAGPDVEVQPGAGGTGLFVPPEVTPSVEGCQVELAVSSGATNATGMTVYGLAPDGAAFERLAVLPAGTGTQAVSLPTAGGGSYLFSVSTFDAATEEQGDLLEVDVPGDCGPLGWTGDARLDHGRLLVGPAVDRAYLYLSRDGGPWQRVPADPQAFVELTGGQLDFGPHLPPDLAAGAVDIEAWGWAGAALVALGTGHKDAAPPTLSPPPNPVLGGGGAGLMTGTSFTSLDWIAKKAITTSNEFTSEELLSRDGELLVWTKAGTVSADLTRSFRWQTNATGTDAVLWQVAAFPMAADLAPEVPGVLLQDVVAVPEGTKQGVLEIDLRPIFAPDESADIGDVLAGGLVQQLKLVGLGSAGTPAPVASPGGAGAGGAYVASKILTSFTPSVLYIRAIPMDGTAVAGAVSNLVKLSVVSDTSWVYDPFATYPPGPVPTPAPSVPKAYSLFLQFLPPANANPEFADCVMVTGFQPNVVVPGGLKAGDFYCAVYSNSDDSWSLAGAFDDFVDAVADAWDAVSKAWEWVQDQLVKLAATYSGCSAIAGGSFCQGMAKIGLSVVLASAGIPPSLPNTEELMNLAKGELKETLVDAARQAAKSALGYDPCDAAYLASKGLGTASCDDIADKLLDDIAAQLAALKTQDAAATTGVFVPYGVNVVPHPWGTLRPPRFRLTIARNTAIPLPTGECRMTLSMGAFVQDWQHKYYDEATKTWGTITEDVSGPPFAALTVDVPDPTKAEGAFVLSNPAPPGASIYQIIAAALSQKVLIGRDYYLTTVSFWREPNNPSQIYVPGKGYIGMVDHANRAWVLLQNGTGVIAHVTRAPLAADCFNPVVAFGVIPLVDQGYPCVPSYGWWWDTVKKPFVGTFGQQLQCSLMYKEASGW